MTIWLVGISCKFCEAKYFHSFYQIAIHWHAGSLSDVYMCSNVFMVLDSLAAELRTLGHMWNGSILSSSVIAIVLFCLCLCF